MKFSKTTAAIIGALFMIGVPAASGDVVYHFYTKYEWRVHRVSGAYQTAGPWQFCAQSHGGTVGCSRAFTVANTVTGQLGVSDGVLSFAVGFNVTESTTTTGSATYKVPRHRLGIAQWRSLFSTKAVHQRLDKIRCDQFGCSGSWKPTTRYEAAYASRYTGPDFRELIS